MFRRFFMNLSYKLRSSMTGRYGFDELSKFLSWFAIILLVINLITNFYIFYVLALVSVIYSIFRTYSKNFSQRQKERQFYLKYTGKIKSWYNLRKRIWSERKYNKYLKCPKCKAYLHVPKGRGKIIITCPKCKNEFTKTV